MFIIVAIFARTEYAIAGQGTEAECRACVANLRRINPESGVNYCVVAL